MTRPMRIGNFSGTIGDRLGAFAENVRDTEIDVVCGDLLAEITVSMISGGFAGNPEALRNFYTPTFTAQLFPELETVAANGTKIVTNAGSLNPKGLAEEITAEVRRRGLDLTVAYVRGDDLYPRLQELKEKHQLTHLDSGSDLSVDTDRFVAANAYTGGWGITTALQNGADIVITGRVADASLILGPAAWWHGWERDDYDKIAGAIAAAHIIECGPQAVGGNFAGFASVPERTRLGFPIAEVAEDGTSVITKRASGASGPGSEQGMVTVDTVTAQLMYEIQGPLYRNPDAVLHVDSLHLEQAGPDRVQVSGAKGSPAPSTTKVGMHYYDGYRGAAYFFPTGLQINEKIDVLERQAADVVQNFDIERVLVSRLGRAVQDPHNQDEATQVVRIAFEGATEKDVTGAIAALNSYGLGGIPGFYVDFMLPTAVAQARVDYWPGLVDQAEIFQEVVFDDGRIVEVAPVETEPWTGEPVHDQFTTDADFGTTTGAALGEAVYVRCGDKGGNANVGVWVPRRTDGSVDEDAYDWLRSFLTVEKITSLLDLDESVVVERYEMTNFNGISFVLTGYFGRSGSSNLRVDQIGKSIGEYLRAKKVQVPSQFLRPELADAEAGLGVVER